MAYCHCTECRKQSSSAFGTSVYFAAEPAADGALLPSMMPAAVEAKLQWFDRPTDSGNTMRCYFCRECGARVFHHPRLPDGTPRNVVAFKAGCIDADLDWAGARHIFTRSAVVDIPEGAERYDTAPPPPPPSTGGADPKK